MSAGIPTGGGPGLPPLNSAEQALIDAARLTRQQCLCGGDCEPGAIPLTPALLGRLRRYQVEHPTHQFFSDDETGTVAVVLDWNPANPDVRAAPDLETLLDELDAGPVSEMS